MSALSRLLRSVRVRVTLAATVVTGVAVLVAGSWLVRTVEASLTDGVRAEGARQLDAVLQALAAGVDPAAAGLLFGDGGTYLQVVRRGEVIGATPGIEGLPPLTTLSSDGKRLRLDHRPGGRGPVPRRGQGAPLALVTEVVEGTDGDVQVVAASPLTPVLRSVDAMRDGLLVAFPLLVGAVAVLSWVLSGRALRPVESIRTEVESITGSTLDRRVPVPSSGDEVAALASTMNAMLDRLEDASTRQQRFVADASHELRSPVATIRTELEVALRTAGADDWPAVAHRLLAEEARLEAVIEDLLLLASLEEGAPLPDPVTLDLATEVAEEVRRRATARPGIVVDVDGTDSVVVRGNRSQLRRAVGNLVDNAVRHARSRVEVSVRDRDGRVRVLVDDDGGGISEADRDRVFARFTRLDDHRTRATGGAGLGLSIVRLIAERHGGTTTVDTAPLGGARFVLDLPGSEAPTPG